MNVYRINLRFDLDDERERMAAEYLQQLPQRGKTTRNRFAVDALCAYISRVEQDDKPLLESIRQMLREEISGASISSTIPAVQTVNMELTEEQKEENRRNALQDLDELFEGTCIASSIQQPGGCSFGEHPNPPEKGEP